MEHRRLPSYSTLVESVRKKQEFDAYHDELWEEVYDDTLEAIHSAIKEDIDLTGQKVIIEFDDSMGNGLRPSGWSVSDFSDFVKERLRESGYPVGSMMWDKGMGPNRKVIITFGKPSWVEED
jgi:hypothetical protein